MVDQFNHGKTREPLVYVHSHFQHFKKTIEDNHFKTRVASAIKKIFDTSKKMVDKKRDRILDLEDDFLSEWGKTTGKEGRDQFKQEYKSAIKNNVLASSYMQLRDDKAYSEKEFRLYLDKHYGKVIGFTKQERKDAKNKYLEHKLKEYQSLFIRIVFLLKEASKYFESFVNGDDKATLQKQLNNYIKAAYAIASGEMPEDPSDTLKEIIAIIKNIKSGDAKSYLEAGGKNFISKLFKAMNETVLEIVTIAGLNEYTDLVGNADKKGFFQWIGGLGGKKDEVATTDFIFHVGKFKAGFDYKANREIYTKTYDRNFGIIDFVSQAVSKSAIPGGEELTNLYAYAMTNMFTMNAIKTSGIEIPKAQDVDQGFLKEDIQKSLQRLVLISTTVYFIEQYIDFHKSEIRDQIFIVLSDRVFFLTEFLDRIVSLMETFQGEDVKYDSLGFAAFAKGGRGQNFITDENLVDENAIKELNEVKYLRWSRLMATNTNREARTSQISAGPTNTNFYPSLFTASNRQMKAITNKVLGNNFKVTLKFKFDRSINNL